MSMKRVRPAPMGRAYRVVKRTAHLTVRVAERPLKIAAVGGGAKETAKAAKTGAKTRAADAKTRSAKTGARGAKKAAASA
jgi:large subunit ribosomal protein L22